MVKFILIKSPDEWATTKQACRDELVVYLFFFSHIYFALLPCIEHCFTNIKFLHELVIISSRITVLVNFQAILLISSGETSANRDIFFTEDAAKNFFPNSKISAQELRHQFFLIWSNLTIMAHNMGLGKQSESWKIIIKS